MVVVRGVLLAGASGVALGLLPAQAGTVTLQPPGYEPGHVGASLGPRMTFDVATQHLVHVNTVALGGQFDTYEYDGASWTQLQRIPCPTFTTSSNLVYDGVRQQCLIATSTGFAVYVSAWVGGGWQPLANAPISPVMPTGVSLAMARDPVNDFSVVIAGTQTFLFVGNQLLLQPAAAPATGFAAFDPVRMAVIAVGSTTSWFDGVAWNVLPGYVPHNVEEITTDFALGRVLAVYRGGLMEWNGSIWSDALILGATTIPSVSARTIACDPGNGDVWVLSLPENGVPGGTFLYQELPRVQGIFQPIGSGCPGPVGVPSLVFPAYPPRFGRPLLCVVDHVPNGPQNLTFLVVGSDATSWSGQPLPVSLSPFGAPGCDAWLEPVFSLPIGGVGQTAAHLLAMPGSLSVVGQWFRLQYATFVPGFNPMSLITSPAARCRIGTY